MIRKNTGEIDHATKAALEHALGMCNSGRFPLYSDFQKMSPSLFRAIFYPLTFTKDDMTASRNWIANRVSPTQETNWQKQLLMSICQFGCKGEYGLSDSTPFRFRCEECGAVSISDRPFSEVAEEYERVFGKKLETVPKESLSVVCDECFMRITSKIN